MEAIGTPSFAPKLYIQNGCKDVSFYLKAFGATELRRFSNDDGSIHVAEFSIDGAMFHLHEVTANAAFFDPQKYSGTTTAIGLFVDDVDSVMASAIAAGAKETNPAKDYEYGYRQGEVLDPFGHSWVIQSEL
jgi:PhnB protein